MGYSYNHLWKLMIDKKINKTRLRKEAGITSNAMANMGKDLPVNIEVLARSCNVLDCTIKDKDYVELSIDDDDELWFTQIHFAEIQALMKLVDEAKKAPRFVAVAPVKESDGEESGLSVYSAYKGRTIQRKGSGAFEGIITDVSSGYLMVKVTKGDSFGQEKQILLSFVLNHPDKYSISEESDS